MTTDVLANGVKLGTVSMTSDIAGTPVNFPVDLLLSLTSSTAGVSLEVVAEIGMSELQAKFDTIAKTFPMPNDTSGYGTKIVAKVASAGLRSGGDAAILEANIDAEVWQIEKGLPGGGTTVRWEQRCINLPFGQRVCTDVPVTVEVKPGPDIKAKLIGEGLSCSVPLSLTTPDGVSIEVRPGNASVTPRGDVGRFLNDIAGIFNQSLSDQAQRELKDVVNDGSLRQALPPDIRAYNPKIVAVQFMTRADGSLGARVQFEALLTAQQLTEWVARSLQGH